MAKMIAYLVTEGGWEGLTMDEEGSKCLTGYDSCRKATRKDMTIAAVAGMLDQDAEAMNCHDFVGVHVKLAALLVGMVGKNAATGIMQELVKYQGLHGLDGVAGCGDEELSAKLVLGDK